jgi:peptide/nickel transport system substrate-binding protein
MGTLRQMTVGAVVIGFLVTACSPAATPTPVPSATAAASAPASSATAPASSEPSAAPSGAAGGGGNLVIVTPTEPEDISPTAFMQRSLLLSVGQNVFQGLTGVDPTTNQVVPALALSWTNPSPTQWVFVLRQGVTFHDGSPFDAAAAAISMKRQYDPAVDEGFMGAPATFKAVDQYTLEMDTATPDPIVPRRMTMIPVSSAKQITDSPDTIKSQPIGTGLYQFVSWQKGQEIDLKLNPNSWLAAPGQFDTVQWQFRAEPSVRAQMIQTGEADVTTHLNPDQCAGAVTCVPAQSTDMWFLRPDSYNQKWLGDVRVRQAIAMAIDRESMAKALLGTDTTDNIAPTGGVGYDPNITPYKFDLTAAKALLAQATAAGVTQTTPISLRYDTADVGAFASMAPVIVQSLTDLGIKVTLNPLSDDAASQPGEYEWANPGDQTTKLPKDRNFMWMIAFGNELMDGSTWKYVLACEKSGGGYASMYCNPAVDTALDSAAPLSGDARDAAYKAVWRTAYDDVAVLPLAQGINNWAYSSKITAPPPIPLFQALPLWLMHK